MDWKDICAVTFVRYADDVRQILKPINQIQKSRFHINTPTEDEDYGHYADLFFEENISVIKEYHQD